MHETQPTKTSILCLYWLPLTEPQTWHYHLVRCVDCSRKWRVFWRKTDDGTERLDPLNFAAFSRKDRNIADLFSVYGSISDFARKVSCVPDSVPSEVSRIISRKSAQNVWSVWADILKYKLNYMVTLVKNRCWIIKPFRHCYAQSRF